MAPRPARGEVQRAEHLAGGHPLVGHDQHEVAIFGPDRRPERCGLVVGEPVDAHHDALGALDLEPAGPALRTTDEPEDPTGG